MLIMKRGEVWWVNFDPSPGSEIQKKQPAVIVCNNVSISFLNRVQVVPIARKTENIYPSEAVVIFKGEKSKAMTDQITTVKKERLFQLAGIISEKDMQSIEKAIKLQLDIHW
jgi:mRNA interferase MazF